MLDDWRRGGASVRARHDVLGLCVTLTVVRRPDQRPSHLAPGLHHPRQQESGGAMRTKFVVAAIAMFAVSAIAAPPPAKPVVRETSCIHCHGGELFDDAGKAKVRHFG